MSESLKTVNRQYEWALKLTKMGSRLRSHSYDEAISQLEKVIKVKEEELERL